MPVRIPVETIRRLCDPFRSFVWGDFLVTRGMVLDAIGQNRFQANPTSEWTKKQAKSGRSHAERIAYFAYNGWDEAIQVDVGIPGLCCHVDWPIQDGNHRFAAAIFRGDRHIMAYVSGDIDYAFELFGVDLTGERRRGTTDVDSANLRGLLLTHRKP